MRQRPFQQVDVFTATPYLGNPLAVVLDAEGLATEAMQQFTNWTNLSEATFLLPPTPEGRAAGADYRVRIFCPGAELPFAGHPTLGTCHAWLQAGGQPRTPGRVVQECGVGLVTLRQDGERLEAVVHRADQQMYTAKRDHYARQGRDRTARVRFGRSQKMIAQPPVAGIGGGLGQGGQRRDRGAGYSELFQ